MENCAPVTGGSADSSSYGLPMADKDSQDGTGPLRSRRVPVMDWDTFREQFGNASMHRGFSLFRTLAANHPDMAKSWIGSASRGSVTKVLDIRSSKLLLLRTSWNCGGEYEWANHIPEAKGAGGLTDIELVNITRYPGGDWTPSEAVLLDMADELHQNFVVSDDLWARLKQHFSIEQIIEGIYTVGVYHGTAMLTSSLCVAIEPNLTGFPTQRTR